MKLTSALFLFHSSLGSNSNHQGDLNSGIAEVQEKSVPFRYWNTVPELETLLFAFVKSIGTSDFKIFQTTKAKSITRLHRNSMLL